MKSAFIRKEWLASSAKAIFQFEDFGFVDEIGEYSQRELAASDALQQK